MHIPDPTIIGKHHHLLQHEKGEAAVDKELQGEWLDASKIETLNLCPRKYFYRHISHLVPKGEISTALSFGQAWHQALACWYLGQGALRVTCPCPSMQGCEWCAGNQIPQMLALFLLYYPSDPEDPKDPRTQEMGVRMIKAYLAKWQRESFEVIGAEVPFILPFYKPCIICRGMRILANGVPCMHCEATGKIVDFYYVGKIDLIILEDGQVKVIDHKTTTRFGMQFEQQFKLSIQFSGYMRAIGEIMGLTVNEGMINAARITSKIDEDSFLRLSTTRTEADFFEWECEVHEAIASLRRYAAQNFYPKHAPFSCSAYNRTCEYYNLCTADQETRQIIIQNAFERVEWNPVDGNS